LDRIYLMRILILGSGAREHALAWKLSTEIGSKNIFIAPGNGGTEKCGQNVEIGLTDFEKLKDFCVSQKITILLPGSEEAIASGIRDEFEADDRTKSIFVFSPDKFAGQLESSKAFAKEFMAAHKIPTAGYKSFTSINLEEGYDFLEQLKPPYVLKADGLAAGKGVLILNNLEEAKNNLKEMLVDAKFGDASATVVIEEFLDGIEYSVFALTDGVNYILLPEAKDYKRIGEGDTGLNTGGMGAVSPVPFFKGLLKEKTVKEVVEPTIKGLAKSSLNYRGFVFFGLIAVNNSPYVIEYNVRMGDPETEVVIPRLNESLSDILAEAKSGRMMTREANMTNSYCTTVFAVSEGYPEAYEKGQVITLNSLEETLFHAGTTNSGNKLLTNGGRVLAATQFGDTMDEALKKSYSLIEKISFKGKTFRTDIGKDLEKYI